MGTLMVLKARQIADKYGYGWLTSASAEAIAKHLNVHVEIVLKAREIANQNRKF